MAYILLSSVLALVALTLAIVPVTVILLADRRAETGARAVTGRAEVLDSDWPIAA